MGRARKNDPDHLLDAAEAIVLEGGAAALTIENVAKRAGVTNGGVQYAFRNKDALITAMFDRWGARYRAATGPSTEADALAAYIHVLFMSESVSRMKAASLMAALTRAPDYLEPVRQWYDQTLAGSDRRERLAFLAAEGAFLLRHLGLMRFDDATWSAIHSDVDGLLKGATAGDLDDPIHSRGSA